MTTGVLGDAVAAPTAQAPAARGMVGDAGFAMAAKLLYLVTRLGLPPLILAHISLAEYGLWAACFVIVGYIGLADLGLSSVYVRYVARMNAQGDTDGISRTLSTGMLSLGAIACVLLGVLYALLPAALDLLKIEPAARGTAAILVLGTAAVFLADMALGGFAYLLHGMQRIRLEQQIWVAAFTLEMVLIVAFLHAGLGVVALLAAYALRYAFSLALTMRQAFRVLPALRLSPRAFDRSLLRELLGFGLRVQSSTMFAMVLHSADRVVAGLDPRAQRHRAVRHRRQDPDRRDVGARRNHPRDAARGGAHRRRCGRRGARAARRAVPAGVARDQPRVRAADGLPRRVLAAVLPRLARRAARPRGAAADHDAVRRQRPPAHRHRTRVGGVPQPGQRRQRVRLPRAARRGDRRRRRPRGPGPGPRRRRARVRTRRRHRNRGADLPRAQLPRAGHIAAATGHAGAAAGARSRGGCRRPRRGVVRRRSGQAGALARAGAARRVRRRVRGTLDACRSGACSTPASARTSSRCCNGSAIAPGRRS